MYVCSALLSSALRTYPNANSPSSQQAECVSQQPTAGSQLKANSQTIVTPYFCQAYRAARAHHNHLRPPAALASSKDKNTNANVILTNEIQIPLIKLGVGFVIVVVVISCSCFLAKPRIGAKSANPLDWPADRAPKANHWPRTKRTRARTVWPTAKAPSAMTLTLTHTHTTGLFYGQQLALAKDPIGDAQNKLARPRRAALWQTADVQRDCRCTDSLF